MSHSVLFNKEARASKIGHYFLFNKPYGVLCQFTSSQDIPTLATYGPFPHDVYPVGRLDSASEGLVLLTNDGAVKHCLLEPQYGHPRTYLAQVEHVPLSLSLERLRNGMMLDGRITKPAKIRLLEAEPDLPPRGVPIRYRKNVPTAWLEITLLEGRNRQIRRMTAAIGHPTLRLIRTRIDCIELGDLKPGESRSLALREIELLKKRLGLL